MSNMFKIIIICLFSLVLISCAKTTIYPVAGNTYKSVSTSSDLGYAEEDAKKEAEKTCQKQNKRLVMLDHQSSYHGPDSGTKLLGAVAGGLFGTGNLATSSDDSNVNTTFKCV